MVVVKEKTVESTGRDYWDGTAQVFFTGGRGWGVAPDLSTLCLGAEVEVLAYLDSGTLPKNIDQTVLAVLEKIRELKVKGDLENARARDVEVKSSRTQRAIRTGGKRARPTAHTEHKPVDTRHLKARKRLSSSKVKFTTPGVSD